MAAVCRIRRRERGRGRASKYGLHDSQLVALLELIDWRCMICRVCHAMVLDTGRGATLVRGLICRFCKTRIATHEGSYGAGARFYLLCRCCTQTDPEWEPRIKAALAQYLVLTDVSGSTNRDHFDKLIHALSTNGPEPHRVWEGAPLDTLPQLPRVAEQVVEYGDEPPLSRRRCSSDCRDHPEHIYIMCFTSPTKLHDADTHSAVMHYVGYTRQHPPVKRARQHGAACRDFLVAIIPGTVAEEEDLKTNAQCPQCGRALEYQR